MCFLSAQISSLLRDVLRYKHVKKTKNTRISNERERETILHKMTGKSSSREKKRTFLSLLSSKNNINIEKKSTVSWGPLWDSPTRIKKQKEEEEGRRPPNTISDFALTTPPNEPVAKERNNFSVEEKNAEDASSGKRSFLEASLGGFHATATGDKDDEEEEEETMKDETMTMAKEEQHPGGEKSPAAVGEKLGELLLSRTLASKPPMKGFAFIKSSEFEQFKENYWQRQKEMKKKTKHASMIPRGPPPPPLEEKIKKKTNVPKRRTTAASSNDDDVHQNSPPVVLRGHVYSVVVPSAPSSESSSSRATREEKNRRRRRSFLVKLEAQFGDNGQKWQALEAYVSPSSYSSEESE